MTNTAGKYLVSTQYDPKKPVHIILRDDLLDYNMAKAAVLNEFNELWRKLLREEQE